MAGSQIKTKQIADGAITKEKIPAGAGIETSKLADGSNFVKKDGSVAMTGALDMGNQPVNNVPTPTASGQAAPKSYVDTKVDQLSSLYKNRSARVASTANINLTNPGTAVFDGVTLTNGDRLLVKNQTAQAENGIYVFNGSGAAMTRAGDADSWNDFPSLAVTVSEGTQAIATGGVAKFFCPADDGGTLGTTAITFTADNSAGLTASNFVDKEIPSGAIDGSNTAFILANAPISGTEHVYLNGMLQESGSGNDYTISGSTITMLTAPTAGEKLRVSYRK